jgi:hypothetical protein
VSGNYVYGATAGSGVQVVDVSDPAFPRLVAGNSSVLASGLAVSGNNLVAAGGSEGLQVLDLTFSTVQTPPLLTITRSGSTCAIRWPASVTDAVLETTSQLPPMATWSAAAEAPVIVGDQNLVAIGIGAGSQFFRLRMP